MLKNLGNNEIITDKKINNSFLSATINDLSQNCKIYSGNFYLDSFNYFPITFGNQTFIEIYKRESNNSIKHFYTDKFFKDFNDKKNKFKSFNARYILGSNPGDNYYSNLIEFLPRIFFSDETYLNIIVHRNLSNKFRNFIKLICTSRNIKSSFSYLDDNFYKFENSKIPQFLRIDNSVNILRFFISKMIPVNENKENNLKIYVRREDSFYRKLINEADIIDKLKKNNFKIINPQQYEIIDQIKFFSNAKIILAPHGSSLANIIFCKPGTHIYEISPKFDKDYEINLSNRYKTLSEILGLKYYRFQADSVNIEKHSKLAEKYINKKVLNQSNYYKNIILHLSEIDNILNKIQHPTV